MRCTGSPPPVPGGWGRQRRTWWPACQSGTAVPRRRGRSLSPVPIRRHLPALRLPFQSRDVHDRSRPSATLPAPPRSVRHEDPRRTGALPPHPRHPMINPDRLTVKSAEALNDAVSLRPAQRQSARLRPPPPAGAARPGRGDRRARSSRSSGVNVPQLREQVDARDGRASRSRAAPSRSLSRELNQVIDRAEEEATIARRRVRLHRAPAPRARRHQGQRRAGRSSAPVRADARALLEALQAVRGSHRVTDQTPEDQYQALQRFTRDLTEQARKGKLDPGHRPRRGDPARDAGAVPPHQEQPRPDR